MVTATIATIAGDDARVDDQTAHDERGTHKGANHITVTDTRRRPAFGPVPRKRLLSAAIPVMVNASTVVVRHGESTFDAVPPQALVVLGIVSVQVSSALAKHLFSAVGSFGQWRCDCPSRRRC